MFMKLLQILTGLCYAKGASSFKRNKVWHLEPRPKDRSIIGIKWVFKDKLDEFGITTQNTTRLVVQDYNQEEGIDYLHLLC